MAKLRRVEMFSKLDRAAYQAMESSTKVSAGKLQCLPLVKS